MPVLTSDYEAPLLLRSGQLNTLFAHFLRRVERVPYRRERIDTPDGDFLDLDWMRMGGGAAPGADRLAILAHGLEGSARRTYMRGMARALQRRGWDVLAWNLRGCSGDPNRLLPTYHSGLTEDVDAVVRHALSGGAYETAALVGFSLGGNLVLKYLGERGAAADARIRGAVAISAPVDLTSSAEALARFTNAHYARYFLRKLRAKVAHKAEQFAGEVSVDGYGRLRTLADFDDRYTAPLNGFESAADYYRQSSSRPLLSKIRVPALLLNAADDPFLAPPCFPAAIAAASEHFFLEAPADGGHVGFVTLGAPQDEYWSERRTGAFLERALAAPMRTLAADDS